MAGIAAELRDAKELRHPYSVEQYGMTRSALGDDLFLALNAERHRWLINTCIGTYDFDQLPNGDGQKYLFENLFDAVHFKLRFPTRQVSAPLQS